MTGDRGQVTGDMYDDDIYFGSAHFSHNSAILNGSISSISNNMGAVLYGCM